MPPARRIRPYDVFLSYASEDEPQARALQLGLQRLAKPWYSLQALRVFRDRTALPVGDGLWSALKVRLEKSDWLVLLASPEAADSKWVECEVRWWRDHNTEDGAVERVVVVRTAGEPHELPPALRDAFKEEQAWATLRRPDPDASPYPELLPMALRRLGALTIRRLTGRLRSGDPDAALALRHCVVDVGTAVRGIEKEELAGDDRRQRRFTRLTATLAVVALAALATLLGVVNHQNDDRHRAAVAADLVLSAAKARDSKPRLALMLGIAADHLHPDARTRAGLVDTLTATRYRGTMFGATAVAFAPNRPLAAAVDDRTLRLWQIGLPGPPVSSAEVPRTDGNRVATLAFSPDGRLLAAGAADGAADLYATDDPTTLKLLGRTAATRQPTSPPVQLGFTGDGRHLVIGTDDSPPRIWDVSTLATPTPGATLPGRTAGVSALAIARDGRTLAVADNTAVELWDVGTPSSPTRLGAPLTGRPGEITALSFSATGLLAVGGTDRNVAVWDVHEPTTPSLRGTARGNTQAVTSVAFAPAGSALVSGGVDGTTRLWDVADPTSPKQIGIPLDGRTEAVRTVAFSGDGTIFASSGDEGETVLWNVADPAEPHEAGQPQPIAPTLDAAAVDPDGRTVAVTDGPRRTMLVDVSDTAHVRPLGGPFTPEGDAVIDLAFAPVGHTLATAGNDVTLWDTATPTAPRPLGVLPVHDDGRPSAAATVQFSPDGKLLAAAYDDGEAQLWDVSHPAAPTALGKPLKGPVTEIAFAPDGKSMALGLYLSETLRYDITRPDAPVLIGASLSGQPDFRGFVDTLTYSPDGTLLATASGNQTAILWNLAASGGPQPLGPPLDTANNSAADDITFSHDGTLLLTLSPAGDLIVSDLTDPAAPIPLGRPLRVDGFGLQPGSLTAFPDGHTVLAGRRGGALVLVDLAGLLNLRDHGREQACALLGTGFTEADWALFVRDLPYEDSCPRG